MIPYKYIVSPEWIQKLGSKEREYVSPNFLIAAYGVDPTLCFTASKGHKIPLWIKGEMTILKYDPSGKYDLKKCERMSAHEFRKIHR